MGKRLLLVRHGKSDWGNSELSDFDRPLNARGHKNAPEMAARVLAKKQVPEFIVSSPALRAITTAKLFCSVWETSADRLQTNERIYEANTTALLQVINSLDNGYDSVAMFGHNPGFTDLANYLSDAGIYNLPTCGTILMEFDTDNWAEVSAGSGTLVEFDYPKNEDA